MLRFADLSPQAIEKIKQYRWDRFIEKHEGPDDWERTLEFHSLELMEIDGYAVLLPVDYDHHHNITVLRCNVSEDQRSLTLFLKDTTFSDDPELEHFYAGFVAICDKVPGEAFYLTIFYHEWYITGEQPADSGVRPTMRTPVPAPRAMSFEEWLTWRYEDRLTEWVAGQVVIYPTVTPQHQRLVAFFTTLLTEFNRLHALGQVLSAPQAMRATADGNGRRPDVMFVAVEHRERLTPTHLAGPADLIIEVVSQDSSMRDSFDKKREYEAAGVREYWVIDVRHHHYHSEFCVLGEDGRYDYTYAHQGIYHSTVLPNFWLSIDWLWEDEPNALRALAQIEESK